jgi:hypothetical protein
MLLPFFRRGPRPRVSADDRLGQLRKVLDRMPLSAPPARALDAAPEAFRSPLALPARTAMIDSGFTRNSSIRGFATGEIEALITFSPEVLIAPLALALTLASHPRRPTVANWMVVMTSLDGMQMEQRHRDFLWQAFGIPIFEQLRGWDGAVIARECEVHDGLHVDEQAVIVECLEDELVATSLTAIDEPIIRARTGRTAQLLREHCECGAETPRLRNLALVRQKARYAVA